MAVQNRTSRNAKVWQPLAVRPEGKEAVPFSLNPRSLHSCLIAILFSLRKIQPHLPSPNAETHVHPHIACSVEATQEFFPFAKKRKDPELVW